MKRTKRFARTRMDNTKQTIEVDVPIMPTLVFAKADHLPQLARIASSSNSTHPPFSLFRHYDVTPIVADSALVGMRQEESDAAEAIQKLRDIEDRHEQRRARAEAARNARERRKALRAERQSLVVGDRVAVRDMPAFAGLIGVVERADRSGGTITFGGRMSITVESWQVIPTGVIEPDIAA